MIHKEFAIDPAQVNTIQDLQHLIARFGYEKGALISAFPKKWFKEVAQRLQSQSSGCRADSLSEVLQELKTNAVVRFARESAPGNWIDVAVSSHEERPFHRIIEQSFTALPVTIASIYEIKEADLAHQPQILRTSDSIAQAAKGLLFNAEKVTIFDPYFCLGKPSYQKTLLALMAQCQKGRVRFQVFSEDDRVENWGTVQHKLNTLQPKLPDNIELRWLRVSDDGTGFMHSRGLFTGKGGLVFDRGFEEPHDHDQRNTLFAAAAIQVFADHGISIPQQLSVIGFDDVLPQCYFTPRLTTIRSPIESMAINAARLCIEGAASGISRRFEPLLVRRSSVSTIDH